MSEIFTSGEMKSFEKRHFSKLSSYSFMQNAGRKVFEFINNNFNNEQHISVLCGPGNNGGDGFVVAKHLMEHGYQVEVYTSAKYNCYTGDALLALKQFRGNLKK